MAKRLTPEKQQKLDAMLAHIDAFVANPENIEKIKEHTRLQEEEMERIQKESAQKIREIWDVPFDI